ncbi:MAG: ABC transporter permease [Oscillospiraceae bacterium]|nr:ABC transporter permease [Oscillospiraceae bacterium]
MKNTVFSRSEYLEKIKKEKIMVRSVQIAILVLLLAGWEIAAQAGMVDSFIVSSPVRMIKIFIQMAGADLVTHILYTVAETLIGFTLGVVMGFFIATALWFSRFASKVCAPFLVVLNSLPKIALGPVIIVWSGAGAGAIITMAVAISLIVTVMELSHGFYSTDSNLLTMVESFGAGKTESFCKIVLPCNIPVLFQSMKVNIGLSLVGVIAGEFLVSEAGLGYLIVYAGQVFKMDLVMMSVILLGFIAFIMYSAVSRMEKIAVKLINHI